MAHRYHQSWHRGTVLLTHRVRAEKAFGGPLPVGAEVHHADGSKLPDAPLVICQDRSYHYLLHLRMRVRAAGANPNTHRLCVNCGPLPIDTFTPRHNKVGGVSNICRPCKRVKDNARYARKVGLAAA